MTVLRALLCAATFLTRLPGGGAPPSPRVAGLSVAFFPLVGLLLGAAAAGVQFLLRDALGLPPHLWWAVVLVGLQALWTGGLHLDGLADVADGLGAGRRDRERALEIMRDSRVGSFGAAALALFLVAKVAVMAEVLQLEESLVLLVAGPAVARFAAVPLIAFVPYVRPTGLGRDFHDHSGWTAALPAAALTGGALFAAGEAAFLPAGIAVGTAWIAGAWIWSRLGGLTGDAYGAAIELAELGFLAAAAMPRIAG